MPPTSHASACTAPSSAWATCLAPSPLPLRAWVTDIIHSQTSSMASTSVANLHSTCVLDHCACYPRRAYTPRRSPRAGRTWGARGFHRVSRCSLPRGGAYVSSRRRSTSCVLGGAHADDVARVISTLSNIRCVERSILLTLCHSVAESIPRDHFPVAT